MNIYYTYAYLREDGTPYYIGKGCKKRYLDKRRQRYIKVPDDRSRIIFLKKGLTEEEAFRHEEYIISILKRKSEGGILHNQTNGGEGLSGYKHTNKTKNLISTKNKGKYGNRKGHKNTKEHNDKISKSNRGRKRTENFKKGASERAKGNKNRRLICKFRGKIFPSLTEASKYFQVSIALVSLYCERL